MNHQSHSLCVLIDAALWGAGRHTCLVSPHKRTATTELHTVNIEIEDHGPRLVYISQRQRAIGRE